MKFTLPVDPGIVRYCPACEEFIDSACAACYYCDGPAYYVNAIQAENSKVQVIWEPEETEISWKTMT